MKRILTAAAIGLAALALSACAAEQPDDAEVQEWLDQQTAAETGAISQLSARAGKHGDPEAASTDFVRVSFDEPQRITEVEFACFGSDGMRGSVQVTIGASTHGSEVVDDIDCSEGPILLDLGVGDRPVDSVTANGYNEHGYGAWAVTIR